MANVPHRGWGWRVVLLVASGLSPLMAAEAAWSQEYANDKTVGIDAKLGETIPLDLMFRDEEGQPVRLGDLIERPTVLILAYMRCPTICGQILSEVTATVNELELVPGVDYDLMTISFDANESRERMRIEKERRLRDLSRQIPPESWRYLTGDEQSIARLTDALGYRFRKEGQDFAHPSTIMFISPEGKIVRYLPALKLLPDHMRMAIQDAAEGKARSFMQRMARLCYAYDPEGQTYVVKVNRIVLAVSLVTLGLFAGYLFCFGRRTPEAVDRDNDTPGEETKADGD